MHPPGSPVLQPACRLARVGEDEEAPERCPQLVEITMSDQAQPLPDPPPAAPEEAAAPVVAGSPDPATGLTVGLHGTRGDLQSAEAARSEDRAPTGAAGPEICVVIGRTRHKMMLAEIQEAAKRGAQRIELRLDFLARAP